MTLSESPIVVIGLLPGFLFMFSYRYTTGYRAGGRFNDAVVAFGMTAVLLAASHWAISVLDDTGLPLTGTSLSGLRTTLGDIASAPNELLVLANIAGLILGMSVGTVVASKWFFKLQHKVPFDLLRLDDSWSYLIRQQRYLVIHTKQGKVFRGWPRHTGWDGKDRSVVLENVKRWSPKQKEWKIQSDLQSIFISGEEIVLVEITSNTKSHSDDSSGASD